MITASPRTLKVTFLELPPSTDGRLSGPVSRDVYSLYRLPSRSCDLLTAIARDAGFADTVALTPALCKRGQLSSADWQRLAESDVVGLSVITRTAPPSYEAARRIRALNPKAKIVFGGPHVSALPGEALRYGDVVVRHEGDRTLVEVLDRLEESLDRPCLADVQGIAYLEGGEVVMTPSRPFLQREDLDSLPFPVPSESVLKRITHQTICTSRGCPHDCEFCSVIENFGRGYRCLSEDRTIDLIRHHLSLSRAPIFFSDDNFTANRKRVRSLLERCLREGIRLPPWSCQARVETALDGELLELMMRSRLNTVMVGFESVNDETLALWNKASTFEKNREAMRRFHEKGVYVHGMFVLGSDADTASTVDQTLAFAREMNLDTAQFFALTPLPGTPLTAKLRAEGRVLTEDWHLYDAQHVVVQPRRMTPIELQEGVARAFRSFYSPKEGLRRLFVKAPHRFQGCLIRFLGRRLFNRIVRETLPHQSALERLSDWLDGVDDLCSSAGLRLHDLGCKAKDAGGRLSEKLDRTRRDLSETRSRLMESLDERLHALHDGLVHLTESYHPFCRRLLDEVRLRLHAQAEAACALA